MGNIRHYVDYNQLYSLSLHYDAGNRQLRVAIDTGGDAPRLNQALARALNLGSQESKPKRVGDGVTFPNVSREFTLYLGSEPIGEYTIDSAANLSPTMRRPLTVDETRRMGTFHDCEPYPQLRPNLDGGEQQTLLKTAKSAVFTDIHTHSSGQISARGLLEVAMRHKPYFYPTDLLREAGISTSTYDIPHKKDRSSIKRIPFPPLERKGEVYPDEVDAINLHALPEAELAKLAARMALPADRQSTFTQLEYNGNRFRYPFSKDTKLTKEIRKKEAQEYAAQGVNFALTAYVGLDNPDTLRTIHEAVDELKADAQTQNFAQRYMIGIPRKLSSEQLKEKLDKAQILLDSPYIMGVDILGYEANKTKEFIERLDDYAKWANEHKPGSFIRVHAGENDKNHDNVKDFLKIAVKYPNLKFLVGHGVYGMDEETIRLAKKLCKDPKNPQLTIEFNPSSNIALNNVDDLRKIPFAKAIENGIPFTVSSDSAGMYQTDAKQLGLAAYYAGLDGKGFAALKHHQEHLVAHMQDYSKRIAAAIPQWDTTDGKQAHFDAMFKQLAGVEKAPNPPSEAVDEAQMAAKLTTEQVTLIHSPKERVPEFEGKVPITVVGASGSSWNSLSKGQQRENAIAIDMLIHALGDTCYLVQGRNKKTGLSKVINQALHEANATRKQGGKHELYNVGLLVNPSFDNATSHKHLTHMVRIDGEPLVLADAVVDHTFDHHGVLIAVGGAQYTRDIIHVADQRGIHAKDPNNRKMMLLLANTEGASAEKASVLHPDYTAMDGCQLLSKLYKNQPDLFASSFKPNAINSLYKESAARVASYGYNSVDETVVSNAELIPPKLVVSRGGRG